MQQHMKKEMLAPVLVALLLSGCARQPPISSPQCLLCSRRAHPLSILRGRAMMGNSSQQARN